MRTIERVPSRQTNANGGRLKIVAELAVFAVEARDFTRGLAVNGALLQICPFIARHFALGNTKLSFELSVFPIKLQNHQRPAGDLRFAIKLIDLLSMQQQFPNALCGRDFVAGAFVRLNIGVVKKGFAIFDSRESIADVCFARANGFNLAPLQLDASFVALENVIIAQRLAINNRLRRHTKHRPDCLWNCLGAVRALKRLERQLACDDFLERNIGKRHPRRRLHHRPMSQTELTYALGDNVDQKLLIRDNLGCFLEKLSRHMAQGTNGAGCSRRELKNSRHAACESGWDELRREHGKNECGLSKRSGCLSTPKAFGSTDLFVLAVYLRGPDGLRVFSDPVLHPYPVAFL